MSHWYPLSVPTIGESEITAVTRVLRSGNTTMGVETERFEDEFAHFVGAQHAVMVNSGSSADLLIAMGLRELGGEVLVPAVTWPTQVWAWVTAGFKVTLVDVEPHTLNASLGNYEDAISHSTKILSLVHLMGNPCEIIPIIALADEWKCFITEDCCEALGASYGGHHVGHAGIAASWSFFFSHQMTTMEGGMVTTNDLGFANRLRGMRSHGWTRHLGPDKYTFADIGFNLRPTEVQAAIGRVQLHRVKQFNDARRRAFGLFADLLDRDIARLPHTPAAGRASWFGIPLMCADRDGLRAHLESHGVETRPILAGNLARQPVAGEGLFNAGGSLPGADTVHDHGLFIGLHPANYDIERIAGLVNSYDKVPA